MIQLNKKVKRNVGLGNVAGYLYKMKMRPFDFGAYPKEGFVRLVKEGIKKIDGYYAVIEYDRELTQKEIKSYELEDHNYVTPLMKMKALAIEVELQLLK